MIKELVIDVYNVSLVNESYYVGTQIIILLYSDIHITYVYNFIES